MTEQQEPSGHIDSGCIIYGGNLTFFFQRDIMYNNKVDNIGFGGFFFFLFFFFFFFFFFFIFFFFFNIFLF